MIRQALLVIALFAAPDHGAARDLVVAIDPGHGGHDPGAAVAGLREADLMLDAARALVLALDGRGGFVGVLTREDDVFLPLDARMSRARAAGADVFLSLHADRLIADGGRTSGMTVYTLPETAGPAASRRLAIRNEGDDLVAGVDLTGVGEDVAVALQELVRARTAPGARELARLTIEAVAEAGLDVVGRPLREERLAVLQSADMPSLLIELGFLSSPSDRDRLSDPVGLALTAEALADALERWRDLTRDD